MAGTCEFELYKDSAGQYRWRLRSANGQIIATGGEGYTTKAQCSERHQPRKGVRRQREG